MLNLKFRDIVFPSIEYKHLSIRREWYLTTQFGAGYHLLKVNKTLYLLHYIPKSKSTRSIDLEKYAINLRTAAVSFFESSSAQLRSNEDLQGPECSNYY